MKKNFQNQQLISEPIYEIIINIYEYMMHVGTKLHEM